MKRKLVRGLVVMIAVFPSLFVLRLLYGLTLTDGSADPQGLGSMDNNNNNNDNEGGGLGSGSQGLFGATRKNYASLKFGRAPQAGSSAPASVDQKYEKVATLRTESARFEEDEAKLRASIKRREAMIQFEQAHGLAGHRQLRLSIGVPPSQFDSMLEEVRGIGKVVEIQVDKVDKTNEYKDLNAQRASLDLARSSLVGLKGHGGQIDQQINLENKILEIEEQIQKLGVRVGEFDAENEFVTIHITLGERVTIAAHEVPFRARVSVAMHWAVGAYAAMLGLLFLASLSVLIIVGILEKLKWIPSAVRKLS